jgi:hypothetical protein
MSFERFATGCPHRVVSETPRRPANALNVEVGTPSPRCALKVPKHWGDVSSARWLFSGGSPLVLGVCSRSCALGHRWCKCGHREEHHNMPGKPEVCAVEGCNCNRFERS